MEEGGSEGMEERIVGMVEEVIKGRHIGAREGY